jgi:TonB family protein
LTAYSCREAEIVAGAVALGEATDVQRETYRRHIAACAVCLSAYGGERQIERTMERIALARDGESWDPDVSRALRQNITHPARFWRAGFSVAAVAIVVSVGLHFVAASGLAKLTPTIADPLVVHYDGQTLTLEKRSTEQARQQLATHAKPISHPNFEVVHNVVTLAQSPAAPSLTRAHTAVASAPRKSIAQTPALPASSGDGVPVWRQGGGAVTTVSHTTTVSEVSSPVASIVVASAYSTREATPVGGEAAINPQPPSIAYAQNAEGTSVFEVFIDERGNPTKCVITASSGYLSLDGAVCRAAMDTKYAPRTVNGRPVSGVYRDAFTFRSNDGD